MTLRLWFCFLFVSIFSFAQVNDKETIFTHVNLITMENDQVLEDYSVLIRNESIVLIGKTESVKVPSGALVIDGTGKYLVPGIAEMHAHIPGISRGKEYIEETLFLYISNGITTIRGMLGEPYHLELKKDVAEGRTLGPRIYTSSPSMNGNTVRTIEEAQEKVIKYHAQGYDFLKIHPGIKLEVFNEMVATANKVGIPYSGHVPVDVGIRRAIESRYGSIDHIDGYLEGLVPKSKNVDPSSNGFFGFNFTNIADEGLINELVTMTKSNNVWIVPTQSLMERWAGDQTAEDLAKDPEMKYISKNTLNSWVNAVSDFQNGDDYQAETAVRFNEIRRKLIKELHDGGVGILLGSDAPQIFNVPGFSIQNELHYMVSSGLTPYEALQTGSVNPARFFGQENEYGMIKPGYSADLVLLKSNPLDNIAAFRENDGVMVRGKWISGTEIQRNLELIAEKYK